MEKIKLVLHRILFFDVLSRFWRVFKQRKCKKETVLLQNMYRFHPDKKSQEQSEKLYAAFEERWSKKDSLLMSLVKTLMFLFTAGGALLLFSVIFQVASVFLFQRFISLYSEEKEVSTLTMYMMSFVAAGLFGALSENTAWYLLSCFSIHLRSLLMKRIYEKSINLSPSSKAVIYIFKLIDLSIRSSLELAK